MDKKEFLKEINFISSDKVAASLYFHYVDEDSEKLLKAPTDVDTVNKKLAKIYSDSILKKLGSKVDYEILPIEEVTEYDEAITYYYYTKNFPEKLEFLSKSHHELFSFKKHKYKNIKGFVIKLTYGKQEILVYKFRNNFDVQVQKTILTILKVEEGFTSPGDETITLNDKIDYILYNQNLIVINLSQHERKLKFIDRIKLHSKNIIKSLQDNAKNIDEGIESLTKYLDDNISFAKKMKPINFEGVLWKTDFALIKISIEKHEKLKKHLKFNDTGDKFSIKSQVASKLFFSLCSDLIMESILSGEVVTVHEKEEIE